MSDDFASTLGDLLHRCADSADRQAFLQEALHLVRRLADAEVASLVLEDDEGGAATDVRIPPDVPLPERRPTHRVQVRWRGETQGLLTLWSSESRPGDGLACGELEALGRLIGMEHGRSRTLEGYNRVRRELRGARERRQRLHRRFHAQLRDDWSTILDLRNALAARADEGPTDPVEELVGQSDVMRGLRARVLSAARYGLPVLIEGATGTGKDLVARALHRLGPRATAPFVPVSCATIPPKLVEAELFGVEGGTYGGADGGRPGLLQQADGGTLYLDEVGEAPLDYQAKLFRAVEGRTVRPIGGRSRELDLHVIAATRVDVDRAVQEGRFHRELFDRLAVLRIRIPLLRERLEDIPQLIEHFLRRANRPLRIAPECMQTLYRHRWPGNVRELENLVVRWCVLAGEQVQPELAVFDPSGFEEGSGNDWRPRSLREVEREAILRTLAHTHGDKTKAARLLGITRTTLHAKLDDRGKSARRSSAWPPLDRGGAPWRSSP